tara:strand:- start:1477 stop:2196 length:720 start_codon:yes stop_codon:yes gene_type:complete
MANKETTYKEVWDKLSKIDCSDKVEKKMNLSYLSWAWGWGVLMEHYPQANYLYYQGEGDVPYVQFPDGTAEVRCRVSIDNLSREMTLSVMDNRNNAIQSPSSRQVNDTKMRCLVKCLAMYGLGHYLYAGEDVPRDDDKEKPVEKMKNVTEIKKPVAKKVEEPMPVIEEVESKDDTDIEWARLFCISFLKLAKLQKTRDEMASYYKSNTKDLTTLREKFPEQKEILDGELKSIVNSLKEV